MDYWINAGFLAIEQLVPVAREAEQLGFAGVALPDHLVFPEHVASAYPYSADGEMGWSIDAPWPDCWGAIAAMAAATERLRFTTCVYVAPLRDVFSLAKSVGTAAGFGPGRVACGVGAGWMREEFDTVGQDFDRRGGRFDEMLTVLRLLWSGEVVEHHGEHIDFPPLRMRPPAGPVPILVGGNTPAARRRAARHDGWIGTYTDLADATRMTDEVRTHRRDAGRGEEPFEVLFAAMPGAARDADALDARLVDGLVIPVVAMAASTDTDALVAGMRRWAERRM
jgi:probable F420-dependent oxidoreductase